MGTASVWSSRLVLPLAATAFAWGIVHVAQAAPAGLSCPAWHDGVRLQNYAVFDGDPRKLAELSGEEGFDVHRGNSQDGGFNLVCTYPHDVQVWLPIPAAITHCDPGGSVLQPEVACH